MAITWGSWDTNARVGVEAVRSSSTTAAETWTVRAYLERRYTTTWDQTGTSKWSLSGVVSGSGTISVASGGSLQILLATKSVTVNKAYGSTQSKSVTLSVNKFSSYNPPAVKVTFTVAARAYSAPLAPTSVAVANGKVTWAHSQPTANPTSSFTVQRSTNGSTWVIKASGLSKSTRSYTDTDTAPGNTYRYRVTALGTAGSTTSAQSGVYTTVPKPPTGVNVSLTSNGQVNVSWVAPSQSAPVTQYRVQRTLALGSAEEWADVAVVKTVAWTDTSASTNTRYKYRVRTENAGGSSTWLTTSTVATTPNAPKSVVATKSGTNIVLTWVNTSPVPGASVEIWEDDTLIGTVTGAQTYTVTGVSALVTHTYKIRHSVDDRVSAWATSNTVKLASAPYAPVNLTPSGTWFTKGSAVTLSWVHSPSDSSRQTQYQIRYREDNGSWVEKTAVTSTSSTVTLTSSADTVEWQVRTTGQDTSKWSPYSASATYSLETRPTVTFTAPAASSTVTQDWVDVKFTDSVATTHIAELTIEKTATSETVLVRSVSVPAKSGSIRVTGLENNTQYRARLRVQSHTWSNTVTRLFTVKYSAPPAANVTPSWDRDRGVIELAINTPAGTPAAVSVNVYILEDGVWQLHASDLPVNTSFEDMFANGSGVNQYRVDTVSSLGVSTSVVVKVDTSISPIADIVLTSSTGRLVRVRYDPEVSRSVGLQFAESHFMRGRQWPVMFAGRESFENVTVSGVLLGLDDPVAQIEQFRAVVGEARPVMYRDPTGLRMWCMFTKVDFARDRGNGSWVVSFNVARVDIGKGNI